mgnify:CR=1 FL=1
MSQPPIEAQITFLYTADLDKTAQFYEDVLGLTCWRDQTTCRIYTLTGDAYVGFCQREDVAEQHPDVIFTLVTPDVDGWYQYLSSKGVNFEKEPALNSEYQIYHCFLRDPNGYLIEIQRFLQAP